MSCALFIKHLTAHEKLMFEPVLTDLKLNHIGGNLMKAIFILFIVVLFSFSDAFSDFNIKSNNKNISDSEVLIQIVETIRLPGDPENLFFKTKIKVTNNSGIAQWARAGVRVVKSGTNEVLFNESHMWEFVQPGSAVYWSPIWSGRWNCTHILTASVWISGDTPLPGYQPDVKADSATVSIPIGMHLKRPRLQSKPSINIR